MAQQVPLIAGEIGENDCAHGYIDSLMAWMDSHNLSYLAWTWDSTVTTPLITPTTSATGSFVVRLTVPPATAGPHTLIAVGQRTHNSASAAIQVKPAVYLSAPSGKVGAHFTMVGVGFGARERVAALWYPGYSVLSSATSNTVGSVVLSCTVPQKPVGSYAVIGYSVRTTVSAVAPFTVAA